MWSICHRNMHKIWSKNAANWLRYLSKYYFPEIGSYKDGFFLEKGDLIDITEVLLCFSLEACNIVIMMWWFLSGITNI